MITSAYEQHADFLLSGRTYGSLDEIRGVVRHLYSGHECNLGVAIRSCDSDEREVLLSLIDGYMKNGESDPHFMRVGLAPVEADES